MPIINTNIAETIDITENGQYDVAKYTTANVKVAGLPRTVDSNGVLQFSSSFDDFIGGATDIGDWVCFSAYYSSTVGYYADVSGAINMSSLQTISGEKACYQMFYKRTGITSVDLSSLTTVSGSNGCNYMFRGCTGITSVDLSSLTTVSGQGGCQQMFYDCAGLTSVDLSSLTTISGQSGCTTMFQGCSGITSVDLSSLTTVSGKSGCYNMFNGCTSLTSVDLSSLTTVSGQSGCQSMFYGCTSLTTLSFPALKTVYDNKVFNTILGNVTGCIVHFPSNLESYGFSVGGTNTTVLYDLPATE